MLRRGTQKLIPSLHTSSGRVAVPVDTLAMKLKSAALQPVTLLLVTFVTRTRAPSKLAARGPSSWLLASEGIVATTLPVLAWTTVIELSLKFGTQMLVP